METKKERAERLAQLQGKDEEESGEEFGFPGVGPRVTVSKPLVSILRKSS